MLLSTAPPAGHDTPPQRSLFLTGMIWSGLWFQLFILHRDDEI